jgi:hypothetical protein
LTFLDSREAADDLRMQDEHMAAGFLDLPGQHIPERPDLASQLVSQRPDLAGHFLPYSRKLTAHLGPQSHNLRFDRD